MTEGAVSGDDETAIKHLSYARACGSTFILPREESEYSKSEIYYCSYCHAQHFGYFV